MKLKYKFETVNMGAETIAVPIGKDANAVRGVLKLNDSGKEILGYLQAEISENELINILAENYQNSREELEIFVHHFITYLENAGLLE